MPGIGTLLKAEREISFERSRELAQPEKKESLTDKHEAEIESTALPAEAARKRWEYSKAGFAGAESSLLGQRQTNIGRSAEIGSTAVTVEAARKRWEYSKVAFSSTSQGSQGIKAGNRGVFWGRTLTRESGSSTQPATQPAEKEGPNETEKK